jgi:hypothetical protein
LKDQFLIGDDQFGSALFFLLILKDQFLIGDDQFGGS